MEITIDTKRDSKDDIRRAVEFLKGFLEDSSYSLGSGNASYGSSDRPSSEPAPQPGLFGMFGNDDSSSGGPSSQDSSPQESSGEGSSDDPGDGSPERIEIVPY